jgi:hypothetical protein
MGELKHKNVDNLPAPIIFQFQKFVIDVIEGTLFDSNKNSGMLVITPNRKIGYLLKMSPDIIQSVKTEGIGPFIGSDMIQKSIVQIKGRWKVNHILRNFSLDQYEINYSQFFGKREMNPLLMSDTESICLHCGKPFKYYRVWEKYCSDRCRTASFVARRKQRGNPIKKTNNKRCKTCGGILTGSQKLFCGNGCAKREYRKNKKKLS